MKKIFTGTMGQLFAFSAVSGIVTLIQLFSVNILYVVMKGWTAPLPGFLTGIFNEETVGAGHVCWGYVMPFFLSNLIANIYGYFQNQKTTFHATGHQNGFLAYLAVIACLILFSTWFQGMLVHRLETSGIKWLVKGAATISAFLAGMIQFAVLFPLEKLVLFKDRKPV